MADAIVERPGLTVRRERATAQFVLHCAPPDAEALSALLPVALPSEMLCVIQSEDWRALHLGPDEWLLIGPEGAALDLSGAQMPHSLVDAGHRSLALRLDGGDAALLVNTGCALNLALSTFSAGTATRTLLGKVQIVLERDRDCFRMQYGRSFDDYVTAFVRQAASDLPKSCAA